MKFLIPCLLLSGCSLHVSTGLIDPGLGEMKLTKGDPHSLSALHTTIQAEATYHTENFAISIGAGPSTTQPLDGRSPMYGGEVSNRITWKATKYFQPYIIQSHGIHFHDSKWYWETNQNPTESHGSDTNYELSTRFGVGLSIPATDNLLITIDYSWMHWSNGRTMIGDKTRQFFGLKKAKVNDGFEAGALFIGVSYEF